MNPEQIPINLPTLSLNQVNVIIAALAERPYREVADLMNIVRASAAEQAQAALNQEKKQ